MPNYFITADPEVSEHYGKKIMVTHSIFDPEGALARNAAGHRWYGFVLEDGTIVAGLGSEYQYRSFSPDREAVVF